MCSDLDVQVKVQTPFSNRLMQFFENSTTWFVAWRLKIELPRSAWPDPPIPHIEPSEANQGLV